METMGQNSSLARPYKEVSLCIKLYFNTIDQWPACGGLSVSGDHIKVLCGTNSILFGPPWCRLGPACSGDLVLTRWSVTPAGGGGDGGIHCDTLILLIQSAL